MRIILVRHGQSQWQVAREKDNWNSGLTPLGAQQAQRLAVWLASLPALDAHTRLEVGSVRASPLQRAQQTAVPLTIALHLPLLPDDNLREADFLVSQRLPSAHNPATFPPPFDPSADYQQLKQRANQALQQLVADAEENGRSALAISHGGLISTILRLVTGHDVVSFWLYNTSLNLIEWKRGRWHLVFLNLWDHLPPNLRTF